MRDRSWPAWVALIAGIAVASFSVVAQNPPAAEPDDAPVTVFSAGRAMKHVEAIATKPHPTGSAEITEAREYLLETLRQMKLEPDVQAPRSVARPERNIVVRLKGSKQVDGKAILLCAHYDSVRSGPGAGDNSSGVAVVLETLRALKAWARLDRDVIALFDDGEEIGLRGASLFIEEHPWANEVGVVLNFDSRGNHGPSMMFETSEQNGWLIRQFAEAVPHPLATSMSMDIYKIMPNDTDLSVFKKAKYDGLNFAFSRGLAYYHSPEDTPENLDPGSLQHQGENALAMARKLGDQNLDSIRQENVVYFSVLDRHVFSYPIHWAMPLAYGSAGFLVLAILVGLIMGRVKFSDLIVGIALWPVAAFLSIFVAGGFFLVVRDMSSPFAIPLLKFDIQILTAGAIVAGSVTLILDRIAAKGRSIEALGIGSLVWWVVFAILTAIFLPGMSYLFTWPSASMLLGLTFTFMMKRGSGLAKEAILLGAIPALVLFPPLTREAFEGLSFRVAGPMMILVVLFLGGILPLLAPILAQKRED